jgi:hypothetical protein
MKKTAFLEIVELPDGDFALQRTENDDEPLVVISFSKETKSFLKEHNTVVAKAMIGAGVQAVGAISQYLSDDQEKETRVIH